MEKFWAPTIALPTYQATGGFFSYGIDAFTWPEISVHLSPRLLGLGTTGSMNSVLEGTIVSSPNIE